MAQGEFKKRSDKFSSKGNSKASKRNKPLGPRKGGQYIAPKKASKAKSDKLKRQLTKEIGQHIEKEIHQRAASAGNEFRILSNSSGEGSSTVTPNSSKTKGNTQKQ